MNVEAIATLCFNGGALIAFWVWARSSIVKATVAANTANARCAAIEARCVERKEWMQELSKAVNVTARNVVKLAQGQGVDGLESPD